MSGLTLQENSDGNKLQATYTPAEGVTPPDEAAIKHALEEGGFASHYLFANACAEFAARCKDATAPVAMPLGERRDGTFSLTIAPDLMSATVTITPPYGGAPVTPQQLHAALAEQNVTFGIQDETIKNITTACRALNKPIAIGQPPQQGEDAQLVSLIPEIKDRCPHAESDDSIVDYRDLGGIVSVSAGQPLMRHIPPTEGTPGTNIKGEVLPGTPGKDTTFAPGLSGATLSPDDPDLLVAEVAGQPLLVPNGIIVEPTINLKTVDLSTGNISIDGSLVVAGDIASGMEVKVTGDLVIGGTVEAAVLEAGGNIEIKGGTIFSHIHAGGSITALFAERAHLHAAHDVNLGELSMQSELKAGGKVVVGDQGGKKGHVIGGLCRAVTQVRAIVIGSPAGVPTRIEVGIDPDTREKLGSIKDNLDQKQAQADELHKALAYLYDQAERTGSEAVRQKEKAKQDVEAEIAELVHQKKRLQKRLETIANASISVKGTIYYGVQLVIGEKTLTLDEDLENVAFHLEDDQIAH